MAPKKKEQWVVPHADGWAVKGGSKITRVTHTQKEAIEAALEIARKEGSDVIIQNSAGAIRLSDQHQRIQELLQKWDSDPDHPSDEWWDNFQKFLQEH